VLNGWRFLIRGSQRDVVYLGCPIVPSYMSPSAGGWGGGSFGVLANEYSYAHGAQINFGRSNSIPYVFEKYYDSFCSHGLHISAMQVFVYIKEGLSCSSGTKSKSGYRT
jgi:hypothetical protein